MSSGEERRRSREEAVEAAYHSLSVYQVDSSRIVFINDGRRRAGGYGIVRRAQLHHSAYLPTWLASRQYGPPQLVAVKQMRMSVADDPLSLKAAFTKELLVWSSLATHPGIAKFLGFYADFERLEAWLISPWEPHGSVSEFIHRHELEVPEKLSLVYDTIDALVFLHQFNPPICHGDIKSANVLVNAECRAVLCDFGLARLYEDSGFGRLETSTGFRGSIRWCSPELLDGQPRTASSDIYAWAWLVWEVHNDWSTPIRRRDCRLLIIRKIFESPRPQVDGESRLSDCLQVWELMTRCWAGDPSQRPTSGMCRTTVTFLPRCPPTRRDGPNQTRSPALLENLGDLESWKGNYEEGVVYLEQALQLYEQEGNDRGIASVLRKQASISYRHSYHIQAFDAASASLEKFKSLNDPLGIAEALYLMGSALTVQWDTRASPFLRDSLTIFRTHGIDVGVIQCLERLGEIQRRDGERQQALATLEEAVEIASRCGDKLGEAKCLIILGVTQWDLGDLMEATSTLSVACEMARSFGWEHGVCTALWDLGSLKAAQNNHEEAIYLLQESIAVARRSRFPWRMAQGLEVLGDCLQDQNRLDEAAIALEESFSVYQSILLAGEAGDIAVCLGDLKRQQGSLRISLFWYDAAAAEARKLGSRSSVRACLERKGVALEEAGQYDEATLNFEACLVLSREIGDSSSVARFRRKISFIPMTIIKWENRKYSRLRSGGSQQASHLLCDVNRLQRRIPQLITPGLKLQVRLLGGGITS
ncbi:hypothetical protein M407DRAFT_28866 [Tulasnella calospora MUT 4182]|uniref:Protein kinase domain-containing protein n=1 Tax=Tulasnella calospora MUT 4182 TaxID=1051891 RepID=A0A0C3QB67_9AGAM|nr:hypothetical protein M407DRAFT_28866 [Tulasnella calospora MUT 4182]